MSEYPEHDKLHLIAERSQAIGEFLDTAGYTLCEWREDLTGYRACPTCPDTGPRQGCRHCDGTGVVEVPISPRLLPVGRPIQDTLAAYFGIDQARLEDEKQAMLDALRRVSA